MKDTIDHIYAALHGRGIATFDRCILLIVYYIRVVTVEQIRRLDDYKKEYAYQRLKILCDNGYLEKHRGVIPSILVHTQNSDTYTITKSGESFVRCYLLDEEKAHIDSRKEEELYSDHSQAIHSVGLADCFYALLPYWDDSCQWHTEDYIRGAGLRPDARYLRRTGGTCSDLTLYIEEDTGTQHSGDSLQNKFDSYAAYLGTFREEQHLEIPISALLFHFSDMRSLGGTMPQPVSLTNRVAAADRKLAAEQGENYHMCMEDFGLSGCRNLLPEEDRQTEYLTRDQIKCIKKKLREKEHLQLEKKKRRHRMEYVRKRMYALCQCSGLEEWWTEGFRTIGIPGSYDTEYLPLVFPHLFLPDFRKYLELIDYGDGTYDCSMIQEPEDIADVQTLLKENPVAGGHLYFILYEDIWSGAIRVRDYVSQAEIHVIEEE